ncbi:hypothetical protein M0805_009232 [Coniferiporia weirii]|nr:hypothetical protein M0805_009232 [Coniferiporia weirii]
MSILSWFSKKEPEDYEQVLSSLALDVQKRQTRLSEIRLRERRTTLILTMYTFSFWVAYVGAWYAGFLPHLSGLQFEHTMKTVPVFVGPIIIQFSRRIVQTWYTRIGNAEEKTLKTLLAQQRSKVEEIKKKTNYYSTKNLIERYDASPAGSPAKPRPGVPQMPVTPQRPSGGQTNGPMQGQGRPQTPGASMNGLQVLGGLQVPATPLRKQWYDKLADALLGDDELGANSAASRYALICQKCFTHNGLVKEDLWEDTQYVCPKCGHFNPSMRALKAAQGTTPSRSPQSQRTPRSGPRKSEPLSRSLLQPPSAAPSSDRRKSMPALQALPADEEPQLPASASTQGQSRHPALSDAISLSESEEEEEGEGNASLAESEGRAVHMEVDS